MNANNSDELVQSINDMNLSYLLLAQRLIREDKVGAGFRLGLSDETMETLTELSLPQLTKLSFTSQLICRLRIDSEMILKCLTRDSRIDALQRIHTGIILSTDLLDLLADSDSVVA